jgi:hypothetical protein
MAVTVTVLILATLDDATQIEPIPYYVLTLKVATASTLLCLFSVVSQHFHQCNCTFSEEEKVTITLLHLTAVFF